VEVALFDGRLVRLVELRRWGRRVDDGCNNSGCSSDTFFFSVPKRQHNILLKHGHAVVVRGRLSVWLMRYWPQRVGATLIRPGDDHAVVDS